MNVKPCTTHNHVHGKMALRGGPGTPGIERQRHLLAAGFVRQPPSQSAGPSPCSPYVEVCFSLFCCSFARGEAGGETGEMGEGDEQVQNRENSQYH